MGVNSWNLNEFSWMKKEMNYLWMKQTWGDVPCMKFISWCNSMKFHVIVTFTHEEKFDLVGSDFKIHPNFIAFGHNLYMEFIS
jgi:hypothetical protein